MNYFGGKSRIAKYIVSIIQNEIDTHHAEIYIEPFCGGLNIIDKIKCRKKYANDINKYLIALFKHIQSGGILPDAVTKEIYNKARSAWYEDNINNEFEDWELGCYGQLCSYGGRGFDGGWGYEGDEKRKDGTIKHRYYYQERKNNLLKQFENPLLKGVKFSAKDYRTLNNISNAVIYCDPPYQNTKEFANSKSFDYKEFWNWIRKLSSNNIVLISELKAPEDFEVIWSQEVSRSIKAYDKSTAIEKLYKWRD